MSGGQTTSSNSTQVANRTPYAPAAPGLQRALTDADTLYTSGVGGQVYGGPRVADLTTDQSYGIEATRDQAAADNAGALGTSYLQNVLGSNGGISYNGPQLDGNGLSAGTAGALNQLQGVQGVDTSRLTALGDQLADPNNAVNQTANAFMSGSRDLTTIPALQGLFARSQAPSAAETNLSSTAAGAYLDPTTNPWVSKLAQTSADNAAQAQKEAFAASGRYGSGAFSGAVAKAVNDTQSQLFADEYNQERQNQLAANQQIDTARQAGTQLGLGIQGQIGDVESTNNQQRLSGANLAQAQTAQRAGVEGQILGGGEFNSGLGLQKATAALGAYQQGTANAMSNEQNRVNTALQSQGQGLQAASMLPTLDALRYVPGQQVLAAGNQEQAQNQSYLDAAQQKFQEQQQAPWQLLSQYSAFPTTISGLGGTTVTQGTQQQQTSGPGIGQQILGAALGLGGLRTSGGSSVGGNLLTSLFASDERMKENIRPVGELADGQTVHAYNYKGDPRTQIGLLAQEVAEKKPKAVGRLGIGDLMGVDYDAATKAAAAKMKKAA